MRHDLMITSASGRVVHFEVRAPEAIRARLLEAERAAIAEERA
jgi:predicted membrane-bound mannosyltransferase